MLIVASVLLACDVHLSGGCGTAGVWPVNESSCRAFRCARVGFVTASSGPEVYHGGHCECLELKPAPALPLQVTQGRDAKALKDALAEEGIMVRHYAKKEISGYIRISVGKPEHTDALMAVLRKL